jgi:hypothetical protein
VGEKGRVRVGDGATRKLIILPKGRRDAIMNFDLGDLPVGIQLSVDDVPNERGGSRLFVKGV